MEDHIAGLYPYDHSSRLLNSKGEDIFTLPPTYQVGWRSHPDYDITIKFYPPIGLQNADGKDVPSPLSIKRGLAKPDIYTVTGATPGSEYEYDAHVNEGAIYNRHLSGASGAREAEEEGPKEMDRPDDGEGADFARRRPRIRVGTLLNDH